ncbi:hypothetical protein [Amycolatopsis thermoflava]|uniref:hypothetical protein n=1 Tax=Amycolatopsis thermoflava TaxID=84480 RepID=UPI0036578F6A
MNHNPMKLPNWPPDTVLLVRWRLGLFIDDKLVGHTNLTAHWVPVWHRVEHDLVTLCGVAFRRDHVELLDRPRGQPCEPCLLRLNSGRLPDLAIVRRASWRPPRSLRGQGVDRLALPDGRESGPGLSSR